MSDTTTDYQTADNSAATLPPPIGDSEKAETYLGQITDLLTSDKLLVSHTDLSKFDPTSLQDHYRMDLADYEVEVSHNKKPDSGEDFYVILFNNLKKVNDQCTEKVILAYMHLTDTQFQKFKTVADDQIERKRKEAEEKRFKEAMAPIDSVLQQLGSNSEPSADKTAEKIAETPIADTLDTSIPSVPSGFMGSV